MFAGLFVWWVLGASAYIQPLLAVPLLIELGLTGNVRMPRAFVLWLAFLAWMFVTVVQVHDFQHLVAYGWRASLYLAGGAIFLYVFNAPRRELPASRIVRVMAFFWALTVIGGLVGMFLPTISFRSLTEVLLPTRFLQNAFVYLLVHPATAREHAFSGTGILRPKAPYYGTNQWGSGFALSLPFAVAALTAVRSRLWRDVLAGLLLLSIVPLVFSLDRGSWLSVAVSMAYAIFRLARGRDRRAARAARRLITAGAVVAVLVVLTPLAGLILLRLHNGYGDQGRTLLYQNSILAIRESPILGFGAPVDVQQVNPGARQLPVSVGTHGQFWTVAVSHGIPGLALFGGFFLVALIRTGRWLPAGAGRDSPARFWAHVALVAGVVQMPYYEVLPWGLPIMMLAAAVAWREATADPPAPSRRIPALPAERTVSR
jgi:O-antigen ligase